MTVRLMSRDPNNPTSYTIDTGYSFDGSTITVSTVGSYSYQLKMLFEQSDNVESITYNTDGSSPGYYDNNGNWYTLSSTSGTVYVSDLNDFDYSKGISFGRSFSGSYTTSQPAAAPIPKIGSDDISKIYLGTEEISKVYLGSEVVYEASTPPTPAAPVFNINPNYNYAITGNEADFFSGNSSITITAPSNRSPAFNIICDDWSKVNSITVTSNTTLNTHNYGYCDANDRWHSLVGSGAVIFSNNNFTATFNLTDAIRNDIYYTYLDCGYTGGSATYSAFSYTNV